jgi:hypothetical protein
VFITGMRGSGFSYGEQINCEHHLTRDIPNQVELTTSACGRKLSLKTSVFEQFERPVLGKADIRKIMHLFGMLFSVFTHEL